MLVQRPASDLARDSFALCHAAGDLAAYSSNPPLQVPDSSFVSVFANDRLQSSIGETKRPLTQSMLLQLTWDQELTSDAQFLLLNVPWKLDNLHPLLQSWRDRVKDIGRGDEHDLRQNVSHVQVVI